MARENEGHALKTGRIAVGLSAIVGLTVIPGAVGPLILKVLSGGSFCEIVSGPTLGTGNTWGSGHVLEQTTTPLVFNMTGTVYFISTGATAVLSYAQPLSQGFEV